VECDIEEAEKLKRNDDPHAKWFIAIIIDGIAYTLDTPEKTR